MTESEKPTESTPAALDLDGLERQGPKPWEQGDERCHCSHCRYCGRLFRTVDIDAHVKLESDRHDAVPQLIAAARRLAELESALEFTAKATLNHAADDKGFSTFAEALLDTAKELGWRFPVGQKPPGFAPIEFEHTCGGFAPSYDCRGCFPPPSHDEATQIAQRYIDCAFGNKAERPRHSIPARPDYDDDLRLSAYIKHQREVGEKLEAASRELSELRAIRDKLEAAIGALHRETERLVTERDAAETKIGEHLQANKPLTASRTLLAIEQRDVAERELSALRAQRDDSAGHAKRFEAELKETRRKLDLLLADRRPSRLYEALEKLEAAEQRVKELTDALGVLVAALDLDRIEVVCEGKHVFKARQHASAVLADAIPGETETHCVDEGERAEGAKVNPMETDGDFTIRLSEYHVTNLRELIKLCGYGDGRADPPLFDYNTGDWLGELWIKLEQFGPCNKLQPNRSVDDVRKSESAKAPGGEVTCARCGEPAEMKVCGPCSGAMWNDERSRLQAQLRDLTAEIERARSWLREAPL